MKRCGAMIFCDIASFYSPRGGGVTTYHDQKLAYFAADRRHRYVIIAPSDRDGIENRPGGTIFWLKGIRYDQNYRHLVGYAALRRILQTLRPDVVEFGSPYLDYWLTALAARKLRAVTTAFYHADFPDTYVRPFIGKYLRPAERPVVGLCYRYVKRIYGRLDSTLAASNFIKAKLQGLGLRNVKLIPLGVDAGLFNPRRRSTSFRKSLGVRDKDKVLFFGGRYRPDKGLDLLIRAVPALLQDRSLHIVFAGDGPARDRVQQLSKLRANVHDLGYLSDKTALAKVYASSDGFLSPGHQETFGLGIVEALASGLPVLSADSGAGGEMIARFRSGLFFRAGDPDDLVRQSRALVRSDFRPGLARARRYLEEHHSWERIFADYIDHHVKLKEAQG